jgi:hypothetical protein
MTKVSAVPFALGMAGALLLFVAWLPIAVRESRRPYRWRDPVVHVPAESAPLRPVEPAPHADDAPPRIGAVRVVVVAAAFTVWSLWSLRHRDLPHH